MLLFCIRHNRNFAKDRNSTQINTDKSAHTVSHLGLIAKLNGKTQIKTYDRKTMH